MRLHIFFNYYFIFPWIILQNNVKDIIVMADIEIYNSSNSIQSIYSAGIRMLWISCWICGCAIRPIHYQSLISWYSIFRREGKTTCLSNAIQSVCEKAACFLYLANFLSFCSRSHDGTQTQECEMKMSPDPDPQNMFRVSFKTVFIHIIEVRSTDCIHTILYVHRFLFLSGV